MKFAILTGQFGIRVAGDSGSTTRACLDPAPAASITLPIPCAYCIRYCRKTVTGVMASLTRKLINTKLPRSPSQPRNSARPSRTARVPHPHPSPTPLSRALSPVPRTRSHISRSSSKKKRTNHSKRVSQIGIPGKWHHPTLGIYRAANLPSQPSVHNI